ncbi:MAG: phage capsid protein [Rhodospirillales bacterium]
MKYPFPVDPHLQAMAIAYRNQAYIADLVLPRVTVGKQEFKYLEYPIEETFALPDTHVGRRSRPNEVDLTATEQTDATDDYGLDDPIPQGDINDAPQGHSPVDKATIQLTDYIMLDREVRTSNLVFAATSYPTGNKIQLSSTSQFSDFDDSDPIGVITTGLDACLVRPNIMVIGSAAWTKLSQHPKILKSVHGNSGDSGIARRQAVAELFELEEVLVGQSRLNTAKKGQTASLSRVWGKHISLIHRNRNADTRNGLTFGYTAEWGTRIAGSEADKDIGLRGGQRVRVGESVKEKIVAAQAGYFIEDAVA